jgi:hypothetical protein
VQKVIFTPVSIVSGLLAGLIASQIFERLWSVIDDQDPPDPKYREIEWPKLIVAMLLQGAIFRVVRGVVDHQLRRGFQRYTGAWPGEKRPDTA